MSDKMSPTLEEWAATQSTTLVGGVNFTTWPDLKWSRACSHIATLESRLREWHASAPVSVEGVLREDRQGVDFVARAPKGIPKHEWSLDLGDALHNLRSAFDAVAWGMAHFNDTEPTRPKRVTFPIVDQESKWNDAVREWIGELLPEFQARLRWMQPFNYPTAAPFVLALLHDLDIQDKHRDMLIVSADLNELSFNGAIFEFEDDEAEADIRLEMYEGVKFVDGATLGSLHAGATVRAAERVVLRPSVRIQLSHETRNYDALAILHQLREETRRYLDILLAGLAGPEERKQGDGDWLPVQLVTAPPRAGSQSN